MLFLSYIFFPLLALAIAYISQFFFDQDEFNSFIKCFALGILFGLLYRFIFGFIDDLTVAKAHPLTVILKLFLADGIFITLLAAAIIYITVYFFGFIHINTTWRNTSFILTALMTGFFSVYAFYYAEINFIPNNLFYFIHVIALLIISVTFTGWGLTKFEESYSTGGKLLAILIGVVVPAAIITLFKSLYFYNSLFYVASVPIAAIPAYIYIKEELQ